MTEEELKEIIRLGEQTSVEFKPPGLRDGYLLATVTRAVLGMANHADGGLVIIGIDEHGRIVGLAEKELDTWKNDDLVAGLSAYADPFVSVRTEQVAVDGKVLLVVKVDEFEKIPVLCRRHYKDEQTKKIVLQEATCYVRTRRKPETSQIPSQTEMRDLLDIAIRKGIRQFLAQAGAVGLGLPTSPTTEERFDEELGDFK